MDRKDAERGMELILQHYVSRRTVGSLVPGSVELDAVVNLDGNGDKVIVECYMYDVAFPRSERYPDIGPSVTTRCVTRNTGRKYA